MKPMSRFEKEKYSVLYNRKAASNPMRGLQKKILGQTVRARRDPKSTWLKDIDGLSKNRPSTFSDT